MQLFFFFRSLILVFFSSLKLGSLIELMCEKNVINAKLMAGSNLISALNAQRAPHGGGWGWWRRDITKTVQWEKKSSCRRCHLNMTAASRLLTEVFAVLISIDDFFVFPSAWRSVTFGWFRHTQRQRARGCKWDIDSFLRMCRERRTDHRCFTVLPSVLVCFFLFLSARGTLTTAGDLRRDYRMRGSIPTLWQAGWPTVINLSRWQPRDMWDS